MPPLRRAAFVANAALVNLLCDLKEGLFSPERDPDGESRELFRHLEIIDAGPDALPIVTYQGDPEPTHVTLLLTTGCNLRCTYCYASAGDAPPRHMPLQVARRGIDFASTNAKRRGATGFELAFHGGGEPTLNWKTLVGATEYARARACALGLDLRVTCATNGVLSDAKIDWFIANLQGASVSFDGLPESQDKHRRAINGSGTSKQVEQSIERFDQAGFPYGIRVTVTHDQTANLPESIHYICARFRPERIQVEPAYPMGRWSEAPSAETVAFIAAYRQARTLARELGQDLCYSAARLDTPLPTISAPSARMASRWPTMAG